MSCRSGSTTWAALGPPLRPPSSAMSGRALPRPPCLGMVMNESSMEGVQLDTQRGSGRGQVQRGRGGSRRGRENVRVDSRDNNAARASSGDGRRHCTYSGSGRPSDREAGSGDSRVGGGARGRGRSVSVYREVFAQWTFQYISKPKLESEPSFMDDVISPRAMAYGKSVVSRLKPQSMSRTLPQGEARLLVMFLQTVL